MIFMSAALAQELPAPAPRYLKDAEIRAALLSQDWQPCVAAGAEDLTAPLQFQIMPSGQVEVLGVDAPEPLAACWSNLLSALQLRAHDEEPLVVHWTLGIHDGAAVPYPAFEPKRRQLHPFFLFIPSDAPEESVQALRETLEVGP